MNILGTICNLKSIDDFKACLSENPTCTTVNSSNIGKEIWWGRGQCRHTYISGGSHILSTCSLQNFSQYQYHSSIQIVISDSIDGVATYFELSSVATKSLGVLMKKNRLSKNYCHNESNHVLSNYAPSPFLLLNLLILVIIFESYRCSLPCCFQAHPI